MPRETYTFDKKSIDDLRRQHHEQNREIANLKRKLNSIGVKRHEATYMPPSSEIVFVRMAELLGPNSSSDFRNKDGTLVEYDKATGDWISIDEDATNVTSCFHDLINDPNEILPCTRHNGKLVPLWVRTVRHARTVAADSSYPIEAHCPNTYPIKFVSILYPDEGGRNEVSPAYLDNETDYDDFVLNLFEGQDSYLPEGTLIQVYSVDGQWFTFAWWTPAECESSSSSSSGESSSSQSSTSQSSLSSQSSFSSSQSSASSSSQSSLSQSSSSESASGSSSDSDQSSSETQQSSSGGSEGCATTLPSDATLIDGYTTEGDILLGMSGGCWRFFPVGDCE